jgi:hypothetical protein
MAAEQASTFNVSNPRNDLSPEFLRAYFSYDHELGRLRRRGRIVGWHHKHVGYRYVSVGGVYYKEHRIIWVIAHGVWPVGQIDHINGNKTDNRIENLRDVTGTQNQWNIRDSNKNNRTGVRGVVYRAHEGVYEARYRLHGKRVYIGRFASIDAAAEAYLKATEKIRSGLLNQSSHTGK